MHPRVVPPTVLAVVSDFFYLEKLGQNVDADFRQRYLGNCHTSVRAVPEAGPKVRPTGVRLLRQKGGESLGQSRGVMPCPATFPNDRTGIGLRHRIRHLAILQELTTFPQDRALLCRSVRQVGQCEERFTDVIKQVKAHDLRKAFAKLFRQPEVLKLAENVNGSGNATPWDLIFALWTTVESACLGHSVDVHPGCTIGEVLAKCRQTLFAKDEECLDHVSVG
jgi:hypothetical protein